MSKILDFWNASCSEINQLRADRAGLHTQSLGVRSKETHVTHERPRASLARWSSGTCLSSVRRPSTLLAIPHPCAPGMPPECTSPRSSHGGCAEDKSSAQGACCCRGRERSHRRPHQDLVVHVHQRAAHSFSHPWKAEGSGCDHCGGVVWIDPWPGSASAIKSPRRAASESHWSDHVPWWMMSLDPRSRSCQPG